MTRRRGSNRGRIHSGYRGLTDEEMIYRRSGTTGLEEQLKRLRERVGRLKADIPEIQRKMEKAREEYTDVTGGLCEQATVLRDTIRKIREQARKRYDAKSFLSQIFSDPGPSSDEFQRIKELEEQANKLDMEISTYSTPFYRTCDSYRRLLGRTVKEIEVVEAKIRATGKSLAEKRREEARIARHAQLEAVAARVHGETRNKADTIKGQLLLTQQKLYSNCPYCDGPLSESCHADHIMPVNHGGLSTPENMVLVCDTCNLKKRTLTLREFIQKYSLDRNRIEAVLELLKKRF